MKLFKLDILTPEHLFFSRDIESLVIQLSDGELAILAGHAPLITPIGVGSMRIKFDNEEKECFTSEGFLEVDSNGVSVFCQACEWPEDIDVNRALDAKQRAEERLLHQHSIMEYRTNQITLARAMERLRISTTRMRK